MSIILRCSLQKMLAQMGLFSVLTANGMKRWIVEFITFEQLTSIWITMSNDFKTIFGERDFWKPTSQKSEHKSVLRRFAADTMQVYPYRSEYLAEFIEKRKSSRS